MTSLGWGGVVATKSKGRHFFSPGEEQLIAAAVAAAEARTSGEIATMVVEASDRYREGETRGAVLLAAALALLAAVASGHVTIWFYIPVAFLLAFPCHLLFRGVPHLALPFVSRRRIAATVRDRAVRAFYEKGLYRTRQETGILIFISVLERRVWILGDRGIDQRIQPKAWRELAGELGRGIRSGQACAALCAVVGRCGEILRRNFPRLADDVNELADTVLYEK